MATVDLTGCDRELVHIPGTIQPHGVLLVLVEPSLRISHVSSNVAELLGVDSEALIGHPLTAALGGDSADVAAALGRDRLDLVSPLAIAKGAYAVDGLLHRHMGATILERERRHPSSFDPFSDGARLRTALARLKQIQSVDELGAMAVHELRELTGFDRVMLYRFDRDDHGEVLHEEKVPELEPFRGLHYPAPDIPAPARALYVLNGVRAIADVQAPAVPIVPPCSVDTAAPLDLSLSSLRSVSPVHVEYLSNMGVRASMSISLTRGPRLWGLLACHHRTPRFVPFVVRNACELLGRFIALQMDDLERAEAQARERTVRRTVELLTETMRSATVAPTSTHLPASDALVDLVRAQGAAVVQDGHIEVNGTTPSPADVAALATWLRERGGSATTDALSKVYPPARAFEETASGLLAVSSPTHPRISVLWFRPEVVQMVTWGRQPTLPGVASGPLRPRSSFDTWKEIVRGQSAPWSAEDVEAAESLRRSLIEADLKRQIRRAEQAAAARDDLVAIVSHDLRNPLAVIKVATHRLHREGDAPAVERIERAAQAMEKLIAELLDVSKIEGGRFVIAPAPIGARTLIEDALALTAPIAEQRSLRLEARMVDTSVHADRDRILQVFSNLLGNAVKFTAPGGVIRVAADSVGDFVRFSVEDSGVGIPPDELTHVFDRYWQGPSGAAKGAGLGLFIAKGIVEAHDGRISVASEVGKGTTFCFSLRSLPRAGG